MTANLPRQQAQAVFTSGSQAGQFTPEFYRAFQALFGQSSTNLNTNTMTASQIAELNQNLQTMRATFGTLLSTNGQGVLTRTSSGTFNIRAVSGVANRTTVTNGDGSGGDITIDISAAYVGQTSITTLGTIATGTWNATTIAVNKGGTGLTTYAVGDIVYASGTTTLSRLADVATGNVLISGGVGVAPSWGKVGLTTHVTGTLPIANGGTGQVTANAAFAALSPMTTNGDIVIEAGGVPARLPIGSTGQVLTVVSGLPAWAPGGSGSLPVTTKGDLLGYDTAPNRIPIGTNGQFLTADSTQALGLKWATVSPGSSPLTTKGDLYGFSTTNARVPVGTNGQVLTSDSTNANGVSWQTPSGGGGSANITPDTHPSVVPGNNDEFEFGTTIDTTGSRFAGATPWTNFGTVTSTWTVADGSLIMRLFAGSGGNMNGYTQPVSGSTWEYTAKLATGDTTTNFNGGMILATSSGTAGRIVQYGWAASGSTLILVVQHWTSSTASLGSVFTIPAFTPIMFTTGNVSSWVYFKVKFDGTNLLFSASFTGVTGTYRQIYTETAASFIGTVATVGIGGQQNGAVSPTPFIACDWFRKTA